MIKPITTRTAMVKVKTVDKTIENLYQNISDDFKKNISILLDIHEIPYSNNEGVIIYPSISAYTFNDKKNENILRDFFKDGNFIKNTSAYGLFYTKYHPESEARYSDSLVESFISEDLKIEKIKKKYDNLEIFYTISEWNILINDFKNIYEKILQRGTIKEFAKKEAWVQANLGSKILDKRRENVLLIKDILKNKLVCSCPNDMKYCHSLTAMLHSSISSLLEIQEPHKKKRDDLFKEFDNNDSIFNFLFDFKQKNELGKFHFVNECKNFIENPELLNDVNFKDKFKILEIKDVYKYWNKIKSKEKYLRMKEYPKRPDFEKNMNIPFEYNNLLNFKLVKKDNKIVFNVNGSSENNKGEIVCYKSDYLGNFVIEDKMVNNKQIGYFIKFNPFKKNRNKTTLAVKILSKSIIGEVKSIALRKNGKNFFIDIHYNIDNNGVNFKIQNFLKEAAINEKLKKEIERIRFMGVDLGINPIGAYSIGELVRNCKEGVINSVGFGKGEWISSPELIHPKTNIFDKIQDIIKSLNKLKNEIVEYKKLPNEEKSQKRYKIQTEMKKQNLILKGLNKKLRDRGYENLTDALRLLSANDTWSQLNSSYRKYFLKEIPKIKFDKTRENFRKYLRRRLASKILQIALEHNVNVIICEDLNMVQDKDFDSKSNSLTRLFSPATLLKEIEEMAERYGVAFILVPPDGTSKIDHLTGLIGYRGDKINGLKFNINKEKLYVKRGEDVFCIDSDKNAAINIGLMGINHSTIPYKFLVVDKKEENDEVKEIGKRLKVFFSRNNIKNLSDFKKKNQNKTGYIYPRNNSYLNKDEHELEQVQFMQEIEKIKKMKEIKQLHFDFHSRCYAFTHWD